MSCTERSPGLRSTTLKAIAKETLRLLGFPRASVSIVLTGDEVVRALNRDFREVDKPTDVLSFPVDGVEENTAGPRELGDVVICREHTEDVPEAVVHGVLHLCGYDHETDSGEMLELQDRIVASL